MSFVGWTVWKGSDDWQGRKMFMGRNKEDLDTEIYTIWMGLKETRDHKDDWADLGLGAKNDAHFLRTSRRNSSGYIKTTAGPANGSPAASSAQNDNSAMQARPSSSARFQVTRGVKGTRSGIGGQRMGKGPQETHIGYPARVQASLRLYTSPEERLRRSELSPSWGWA
jgi:hypothetical protein